MRDSRQKTARSWTWGVLPAFVVGRIRNNPGDFRPGQILDFGCGPCTITTQMALRLEDLGRFQVVGYDLDCPESDLDEDYSLIHASSVLNVQEAEEDLSHTLDDLVRAAQRSDGTVAPIFASYPKEPRKLGYGVYDLMKRIARHRGIHGVTRHRAGKKTTTEVLEIQAGTNQAYD